MQSVQPRVNVCYLGTRVILTTYSSIQNSSFKNTKVIIYSTKPRERLSQIKYLTRKYLTRKNKTLTYHRLRLLQSLRSTWSHRHHVDMSGRLSSSAPRWLSSSLRAASSLRLRRPSSAENLSCSQGARSARSVHSLPQTFDYKIKILLV